MSQAMEIERLLNLKEKGALTEEEYNTKKVEILATKKPGKNQSYTSYDQVPYYNKQWFFWLMYFTISPVAIGILLFGNVYYEKKGEIKSFGLANKIVAGLIAVLILASIFSQ